MPLGGKRLKQDGPSLIGPSGKPVVKVYIFISTEYNSFSDATICSSSYVSHTHTHTHTHTHVVPPKKNTVQRN